MSRIHYLAATALTLTMPFLAHAQSPSSEAATAVLPQPTAPFAGTIGTSYKESTPDYPKPLEAPARAPNVLLILTDEWASDTRPHSAARWPPRRSTGSRERPALQPLSHHRAVLADARALLTGRNHH